MTSNENLAVLVFSLYYCLIIHMIKHQTDPKAENITMRPDESFRLLRWENNVHDVEVIAADGSARPVAGYGGEWHCHAQMEFILLIYGSGTSFIGDNISDFRAGDLILVGPNLPHYWHGLAPSAGYAVQFDFAANHPFWLFPETDCLRDIWKSAQRGIRLKGNTATKISKLILEMPLRNGLCRLGLFLQICDILGKMRQADMSLISGKTFLPSNRGAAYAGIQKAISKVFHEFTEDLYLTDILKEAAMSKATFERQFRKHAGKSFVHFVTEVRLNFAARQLLETDLSISEIAYAAGFKNLSHFNHKFGEYYQQTPRIFRKKNAAPA